MGRTARNELKRIYRAPSGFVIGRFERFSDSQIVIYLYKIEEKGGL
jgi:hypothetical protein